MYRIFSSSLIAALWLGLAGPVFAQKTISVGGDACSSELEAMETRFGLDMRWRGTPRIAKGACEARNVSVEAGAQGPKLTFARLNWGQGQLAAVAGGTLPEQLKLVITNARIKNAPAGDPVWQFLQSRAAGGQGIDAELMFLFSAADNTLTLTRANLDLGNGNRIMGSTELVNVVAELIEKPEIFALPLAITRMNLSLIGDRRFGQDLVNAAVASTPKDQRPKDMGLGLRSWARAETQTGLSRVLDAGSQHMLGALIDDLPNPRGAVSLELTSDIGLLWLRFLTATQGADMVKALDGAVVTFDYDPNASGF